jgi:hypothetical protein
MVSAQDAGWLISRGDPGRHHALLSGSQDELTMAKTNATCMLATEAASDSTMGKELAPARAQEGAQSAGVDRKCI